MSGGWSLAALARVRAAEEAAARGALAAAAALRDGWAARSAALAAAVEACRAERPPLAGAGGADAHQAGARFEARRRAREAALRARLVDAARALAEAEAAFARAREALAGAWRAREVVARHRLAWEAARREVRGRAEEAEQDDRPRPRP